MDQAPNSRAGMHRWRPAVVVGIAIGLVIGMLIRWPWQSTAPTPSADQPTPPQSAAAPSPIAPLDSNVIRSKAWRKVQPLLDKTDEAAEADIERQLESIDRFFRERQAKTRKFAERILSLKGKWAFIKGKLPYASSDQYLQSLNQSFSELVFSPDELKVVLESAVKSYVSRIQGQENALLVNIRADLADDELRAIQVIPALHSDDTFKTEFGRMLDAVVPLVSRDLNINISKEVVIFAATDLSVTIVSRVGVAVATRLGISAGFLSVGAASSWATLGVGLVAAIVVDIAVDWLLKVAGYDPAASVAEKVNDTLGRVKSLLIDGDPEARLVYSKLRYLQDSDPDATVRAECKKSADAIDRSGNLGLRRELDKLRKARAAIRQKALEKIILDTNEE